MSQNPYNEIQYITFPRLETHPDRMGAVAALFGMTPAPVARCRVLELGCGDANNLIPMAYGLADSRFTGIDLADGPIAAGNRTAAQLGLRNISLVAGDLREIGDDWGEFDYIIAHGLYSWVPTDIRDRMLDVCRERLSPHGVVFISYNTLPGRRIQHVLREMMLYHTRDSADNRERLEEARSFLEFLLESRSLASPLRELMDREVEHLLKRGRGALYHDDLNEVNDPVYFRDFAAHVARHGLQYLGEAEPHEMFDNQNALAWLEGGVLEREQYLDFLKLRRFRQTLLCRAEVELDRNAGPGRMDSFLFSAPSRCDESGTIQGLRGVVLTASHDVVSRVATALGDVYPLPLRFEELIPYAGDVQPLREILFQLVTAGFANLHIHDFPCEDTVTAKPRANGLVRLQAATSSSVTSAGHHTVQLDPIGRELVGLLDGTRTHQEIARDLARIPNGPPEEEIGKHLISSLQWMARMALLEG